MNKIKIVPFAISIIIIAAIIYFSNPYQIYSSISGIDKTYIILALVFSCVNVFLRVVKWKVILEGVGVLELFPIQMLGMTLSNFTPGKIAEPAKSILLRLRKGIAVSASLPTIIWERINDVISTIILAFVAIQALSIESNLLFLGVVSMVIFLAMIVVLLFVMHSRSFGIRIFSFIKKFPGTKGISESFVESFYSIKTEKLAVLKSFVVTFAAWVLEGLIFHIVLLSMGVQINFVLLAGIISLSLLIGIASSLPGGIGSSEFVMIFLLGITGVEGALAVSAVFVYRILTFWFGALIGGLSFVYLSKKMNMKEFSLR